MGTSLARIQWIGFVTIVIREFHRIVRIEGFTASELADVESALTWISQNKESSSSTPA